MIRDGRFSLAVALACAGLAAGTAETCAQTQASTSDQDIVVTARKRTETDMAVPVAIVAVGAADIEKRAIISLDSLTQSVPALQIGSSGGSIQGGTITLRGLGASENNPFADQSVSFNIDGAQIARATVQRMAQMDIGQIEILKGPQALFFGKNSPGGVISIRSADPTDHFEAKISGGYEFNAHEWRGEGYISGPITDTLGFRIAAFGTTMRGWVRNEAPASIPEPRRWLPNDKEWAGRVTLKFEPSDRFNARLKVTHNYLKGAGPASNDQFVNCITPGVTQYGEADDCQANSTVTRPNIGTGYAAIDPYFGDGRPRYSQKQTLASLEMNYDLTDQIKATSITSHYDMKFDSFDNFSKSAIEMFILTARNGLKVKETSQELRIATDFDLPVNFLTGGFYQHSKVEVLSNTATGIVTGSPLSIINTDITQKGEAYSFFGQATIKPTPEIEIAGGGRYSHEMKEIEVISFGTFTPTPTPRKSWNNFSPEVSLSYRPSQNLTLFGTYKRGFLSGGFNGGPVGPNDNRAYDQQLLRGFEGGIKARLFNETVRANLTLYNYQATGLQVTTTNTTPTGGVTQTTKNAGRARLKGVEFDMNWRTPLTGLNIHAGGAYSHARYNVFTNNCYVGQSLTEGCALGFNPATNAYTLQDFAGKQIVRAPDWTGSAGFDYEGALSDSLKIGLSSNLAYSDGYYADPISSPGSRQPSYWTLDANIRLSAADDNWQVALIGLNLTGDYHFTRSYEALFAPGPTGTAVSGRYADTIGSVSRGRQIMLRLTKKFN
ncbi:hypothetical protein DM806_19775 [Sphingobium lactosutens]|uniref:TonB-dependent receptor n=1 Tax=Sphingobium lactosutens TaxID=522773 RepID=UPI0015BA9AAB|nr:TonB-dependent receptor [Sphingobium lactosutens]NWK97853.1 hypothetical protein [Sphingobium lactosutens]